MQISALFREEDAQSEVIGVILMVAIVVILAAVIGTFVLGIGGEFQTDPPQTSFTFDFQEKSSPSGDCSLGGEGELDVTHSAGDKLEASQLTITDDEGNSVNYAPDCGFGPDSEITSGTTVTVEVDKDDTIRVTWESKSGETTATLGTWSGPNA